MWTDRANRSTGAARAVDNTGRIPGRRETAAMSIEVPVLEVLDLADRLRAAAEPGHAAAARLPTPGPVGGIAGALDDAVHALAMTARAVAVDTDDLGATVDAVARSWLALDADLLARRGQVLAR